MSDAPLMPRTVEQLKRYELELTKTQRDIIEAVIKSVAHRHPRWTGAYGNLEIPPPLPPEFVEAISDLRYQLGFLDAWNKDKTSVTRKMNKVVEAIILDMVDLYFGYPQVKHIIKADRGDIYVMEEPDSEPVEDSEEETED